MKDTTMTRKTWLLSAFAVVVLPRLSLAAGSPEHPNVVVILADDLGYGDLGIQGGKDIPTPNIDALANSGLRFTSGYVSGPYCSPTRAGFLTSRYQERFGHEFNPGQNGANNESFGLSLDETTMADRFKAAGYATALIGKWHLGNAPKFHPQKRGFDEFFGFLGGAHPYVDGAEVTPNNPVYRGTEKVVESEYLTDAFGREAIDSIERHKQHPFFLFLSFNAVHNPQQAKPEHLERFKEITDQRRRTYAGLLTALDENVGKVLAKLTEDGLDENTIVVFLSDNGGPQANGSTNTPLRGQKATTWEGGIRVPFFIRWTGKLPAGGVYEQPVIQLDLGPTLLAAAGAPINADEKLDGVNLLPFITGNNSDAPHDALYWRFGEQTAIRKGPWKLVRGRDEAESHLYNLANDLTESTDLSSAQPQVVSDLQADWDAWNATLAEPTWVPQAQRPRAQSRRRNNAKAK